MHRAALISGHLTTSHQYQWTQSNKILTLEQRDFYEKNGYLLVKNLVPHEDLELYEKHFLDICNGTVPRSPGMTVMRDVMLAKQKDAKGENMITKIQDYNFDEIFPRFNEHAAIIPYVEDIIGSDIRAMHTMLINKPPDLGLGSSRHPPHQDLWYFPFRSEQKIVCAWTAMQKIDKNNGCLFVIPGSHTKPLLKHGYPGGVVNKAYHGIINMSGEDETSKMMPVIMEKGDTLFFPPTLIHGSYRNSSNGFRKAISCHYANSTQCKYIDVAGTMQDELAKEIMEMATKKRGLDASDIRYQDLWRFKSRQVKGEPGFLE